MKSKKIKCCIYIRVSTAMQVDGYSLDAQKDRLTRFADFQGMEIVREYCDAGKSGKNITGRPEFTRMLQDVADNRDGVNYILIDNAVALSCEFVITTQSTVDSSDFVRLPIHIILFLLVRRAVCQYRIA